MKTVSISWLLIDSVFPLNPVVNPSAGSEGDGSGWAGAFIFLMPLFFSLAYFGYKRWENRKWIRGVFPEDLPYTKANLAEAYMSLGTYFITIDRFHQMQKIARMKLFLLRDFRQVPENYDEIIERNFHYPIHPVSVVDWVNRHASEQRKKQLIHFLVGLCHIDGTLNRKEYDALRVLSRNLHLDIPFLESCIFSARGGATGNKKESGHAKNHTKAEQPRSVPVRKKYADLLGVSEHADEKAIRQRYRQLVKVYHPDRYARESAEKQEQAHQRFLEIQEAYEFLISAYS